MSNFHNTNQVILEPLKSFGLMTVYQRNPVPVSEPRFAVVNEDTGRILEQFTKLSNAEQWALDNRNG